MSGHFEQGRWVDEPSGVISYGPFRYPDTDTQIQQILVDVREMKLQLKIIQEKLKCQ